MQPAATMERITIPARLCVHSFLKGKPQHFDRGGDFDVLVANDEIQRAGG
jgi:hypothetical protein